ncbi:MAG TPA: indolepyruvate oxidoreductase subunit beta [Dehalococcoidia bacterium]|jgi:indolepyruvate ferredoxin oxidoreductase beta subunit|nr:indolepyruvate oxidoreductase subunit beta [Dehalococcoidia bacterium]
MEKLDLLVTGAGGQGIILASDIIGEVAIASGYDVKKTDTIGMAQRGGSVLSNVRIAPKVWSPLIKRGAGDLLLALEKLEGARWAPYLRSGGIAIVNDHALPPLSVSLGKSRYPSDEEILNILKQRTDQVYFIEGTRHVRELGNIRTLNMFMLGCVSLFMPFEVEIWKDSISRRLPPNLREINLAAFERGRKEIQGVNF